MPTGFRAGILITIGHAIPRASSWLLQPFSIHLSNYACCLHGLIWRNDQPPHLVDIFTVTSVPVDVGNGLNDRLSQ